VTPDVLNAARDALKDAGVPMEGMAADLRLRRLSVISNPVRRALHRRGINEDEKVMAAVDEVLAWLERPVDEAAVAARADLVARVLADPEAVAAVLDAVRGA